MATKQTTQASPVADSQDAAIAVAAAESGIVLTLEQFAIELSRRDNRVELLNAFIFTQRYAGLHKDTEANYQARFVAFIDKPV